jgi:hypothetical protein
LATPSAMDLLDLRCTFKGTVQFQITGFPPLTLWDDKGHQCFSMSFFLLNYSSHLHVEFMHSDISLSKIVHDGPTNQSPELTRHVLLCVFLFKLAGSGFKS